MTIEFDGVFERELSERISARRECLIKAGLAQKPYSLNGKKLDIGNALGLNLVGLALSGGGIRSATFNLGFLQALAKRGVLARCDYLSTVSGGGYIGSCLTSLLSGGGAGVTPADFPFRFDGLHERDEVRHLRRYGRYLAPRHGPLRADTWKLISTYLMGLLTSLATVLSLIGTAAGFVTLAYPLIFEWWSRITIWKIPHAHDLWGHPWDHLGLLFAPAIGAVIVWVFLSVLYLGASSAQWTIGLGERIPRAQAHVLRLATVLTVLGALPLLLWTIDEGGTESLRPLRQWATTSYLGLLGLSSLSLLWSGKVTQEAGGAARRWGRRLVLTGAWTFPILLCLMVLYVLYHNRHWAGVILLACLATLICLALTADINRISMFYFYRNRLSTAYIIRNGGLGLAPNDDLRLSQVATQDVGGPYHLLNATLNLPGSVHQDLHGRRSDFFLMSPLYCGSKVTGYRRTREYESNRATLASAMALSGAATNPQSGAATTPSFVLIMALLNARLGVWAQNPHFNVPKLAPLRSASRFWPYYLVKELLRLSSEKDRFVNLSDGGHIENLGIYELLRRRCRLLIASDAGADPDYAFGDMVNLLRKARIDLGIDVQVPLDKLRPEQGAGPGLSETHVVQGRISYPVQGGGHDFGKILYVKATLVKKDPEDLHEYRRRHQTFPHQSTMDQFFDEAQFESYRELGYRSGLAAAELLKVQERPNAAESATGC